MHKNSVSIALIHNNNATRNRYLKPKLADLVSALNADLPTEVILREIFYQADLVKMERGVAIRRDLLLSRLGANWDRYLGRGVRATFLKPQRAFLGDLARGRYTSSDDSWLMRADIELALTEKHVRAWSGFLDSDAELLFCFEDDAIFKEDSISRLCRLIPALNEHDGKYPLYVDLAGGCSLSELGVDTLQFKNEFGFRHYRVVPE